MPDDFRSTEELIAHYAAVRARLSSPATAKPVKRVRTIWDERVCYPFPIGPVKQTAPVEVPRDILDLRTPTISGRQILIEVARKHGVTVLEMQSPRRFHKLVNARHEACWRMKNETSLSYPQIGRLLHRDHTTAMYAVERYDRMLANGEVTLA